MYQKFLKAFSLFLALSATLLLSYAFFLFAFAATDFSQRDIASLKKIIPPNSFQQNQEAYNSIGEPVLALKYSPPQLHVPDLRSLMVYYGKNGRPDANGENLKLHFTFNGLKSTHSVFSGEKIYLTFDKKATPCKYSFSLDNQETNLWFTAYPEGNNVAVHLFIKNENDEIVSEPPHLAAFNLSEREFVRFAGTGIWELGKWRVDGTLLARQKARWFGPDRFLEKHGGDEFSELVGRQRIDFDEGEACYSIFVKSGDCLAWNSERWEAKTPGSETTGMPLMCVKKVDDRVMNLELWDVEGKGKVMLNLIRSQENLAAQHLAQDFKFVGARTRTQCVFQVNQTRMIVKPNDWLLLSEGAWRKLTTAQEIDDYVNRKLNGTLFVFDEISRTDENKSLLVGTVFNPTRTEMQEVEIAMQPSSTLINSPMRELTPHSDPKVHTARGHKNYPNSMYYQHSNPSNINPLATH